jgi:alpha-1,2-mannosyltransferase
MSAFLAAMRDGQWLTRERIRLWAFAMLAASVLGLAFLLATSDGLNDYQGRPLGTDFSNVYAAGTYVLDGKPAAAFDWPAQHARERQIFGDKTPFYGWHYPPYFLFIAGLLALMPYTLALALWQAATLGLYLGAVWLILRAAAPKRCALKARALEGPLWLLIALAFPAVFVNIGHGHNGFLTAALIGAALVALDRRPTIAGILFGLMAYKPQFGMLIPLVLAATGRWRAFIAATATVAVLTSLTIEAFGPEVWHAFFGSMHLTRVEVLEQGGTGWHKIQGVFSMVRMWGGGIALAYAAQTVVMIAVAVALTWLWRSAAAYPLKAAALIIALILATPYSLDYDLVILAPAIAFLAAEGLARGFAPWQKNALALLWFMPLIARSIAEQTLIPLGVPAMLLMFVLILRQAAAETGFSPWWHSAAQPIK